MKRPDEPSKPTPLRGSAARRVEAIIEGAERAAEKVIDDAEEQARAYLAEAEAEADRAVAERVAAIGELSDALLRQADAIRRQAELLTKSLEEAKARLEGGGGEDAASVGPAVVATAETMDPHAVEVEAETGPAAAAADDASAERRTSASVGAGWRLTSVPEANPPHLTPVDTSSTPAEPAAAAAELAPDVAVGRRNGTPAGARLLATQMAVSGSSREEIAARLRSGFEIEDTDGILDAILGPEN